MFGWPTLASGRRRRSRSLYGRIVAWSRQPGLYAELGVPDTMDGRLEMILLHMVLVLERLRRDGAASQRLGQQLIETLVRDADDALRQVGLGDDSVRRRIPRLAGALAERARDYGEAFALSDGQDGAGGLARLEAALLDHVFLAHDKAAKVRAAPGARRLARYAQAVRAHLPERSIGELTDSETAFEDWPSLKDTPASSETG